MKLCTLNNSYKYQDSLKSYKQLKEQNLLNIELNPSNIKSNLYELSIESLDSFMQKLKSKGFTIEAIEYTPTEELHIFENKETRLNLLNNIKACIILCYKLNIKLININYISDKYMDTLSKDSSYQILLEFFSDLGDFALNKNLILTLGPSTKYSTKNKIHISSVFKSNSQCLSFIRELNTPTIKLNFTNSLISENPFNYEKLLKLSIPYLYNFYVIEDYLIPLNNTNIIKNSSILKSLEKLDFKNTVTIEFKNRENIKDIIQFLLHSNLGLI
ncbi:MAG: hypothetical protein RSB70_05170 [Clostridium sp.]